MARTKASDQKVIQKKIRPALTPEAREDQLISLAFDRAEQQLLDGTASAQVITHYLKLAAIREKEKLELEKLEKENELLRAKTEALKATQRTEKFYGQVFSAMKSYGMIDEDMEYEDYDSDLPEAD